MSGSRVVLMISSSETSSNSPRWNQVGLGKNKTNEGWRIVCCYDGKVSQPEPLWRKWLFGDVAQSINTSHQCNQHWWNGISVWQTVEWKQTCPSLILLCGGEFSSIQACICRWGDWLNFRKKVHESYRILSFYLREHCNLNCIYNAWYTTRVNFLAKLNDANWSNITIKFWTNRANFKLVNLQNKLKSFLVSLKPKNSAEWKTCLLTSTNFPRN